MGLILLYSYFLVERIQRSTADCYHIISQSFVLMKNFTWDLKVETDIFQL